MDEGTTATSLPGSGNSSLGGAASMRPAPEPSDPRRTYGTGVVPVREGNLEDYPYCVKCWSPPTVFVERHGDTSYYDRTPYCRDHAAPWFSLSLRSAMENAYRFEAGLDWATAERVVRGLEQVTY